MRCSAIRTSSTSTPPDLTSDAFAAELWRTYDPERAGVGEPALAGDTVYLCAVDRDGNAASLIQSLYLGFGSGVVPDGTGIVLQCRGAYFNLDENHPNRLEGGKRPLHTLMPGMLLRDGALLGPFGTQGGDAQAQVHLQLVTNLVDYGMDPQAAIEAPRWVAGGGAGSDPRLVGLESRYPAETFAGSGAARSRRRAHRRMGYPFRSRADDPPRPRSTACSAAGPTPARTAPRSGTDA